MVNVFSLPLSRVCLSVILDYIQTWAVIVQHWHRLQGSFSPICGRSSPLSLICRWLVAIRGFFFFLPLSKDTSTNRQRGWNSLPSVRSDHSNTSHHWTDQCVVLSKSDHLYKIFLCEDTPPLCGLHSVMMLYCSSKKHIAYRKRHVTTESRDVETQFLKVATQLGVFLFPRVEKKKEAGTNRAPGKSGKPDHVVWEWRHLAWSSLSKFSLLFAAEVNWQWVG